MTKERCRRTAIILVGLLLITSMVSAQTGKRFSVTFKNEKLATALKTISKNQVSTLHSPTKTWRNTT